MTFSYRRNLAFILAAAAIGLTAYGLHSRKYASLPLYRMDRAPVSLWRALINRGDIAYDHKDYDRAIENFSASKQVAKDADELFASSGSLFLSFAARGAMRLLASQYSDAFADYDAAIKISSQVGKYNLSQDWIATAYSCRGLVRTHLAMTEMSASKRLALLDEALGDLNTAVKMSANTSETNDAITYNNRGDIYLQKSYVYENRAQAIRPTELPEGASIKKFSWGLKLGEAIHFMKLAEMDFVTALQLNNVHPNPDLEQHARETMQKMSAKISSLQHKLAP